MRIRRIAPAIVAPLALAAAAACGTDSPLSGVPDGVRAGVGQRNGGESAPRTFEVTVENLTGGQWLTPPLIATHQRAEDLFDVGRQAGFGVKEIAENGNLAPLMQALGVSDHVSDLAVAVSGDPPPLAPGTSVAVTLDAAPGARFLSFVSMLICTNDGFTGADGLRLPSRVGGSVTLATDAYDAGTELNTEDFADLVPPCPVLTNVSSSVPGSMTSDPALAENGVIHPHPGIAGVADLQPGLHGFSNPVARVTVTRTR